MRKTIFLITLAVSCLRLATASPQLATPEPPAAAEPNHFLHEAEHRRQAIEADQRQRQLRREHPLQPAPSPQGAPTDQDDSDAPCWYVSGVTLAGNRLISAEQLQQAVQPHLSPCLTPAHINRLLAAITQRYTAAGYVASRPLLLARPEDGQPLRLAIEEGFVEAIELAGDDLPVSLAAAFPDVLGAPLQLRQLEQGLDQLNRLRSIDLTADIEPGELQGGSRIVLRAFSRPSRWQLTGGLDNGGSATTGRNRTSLSLALDNPLERNDFLTFYGSGSHISGGAGSAAAAGVYYSIPYGPWSLSVSANAFRYRTQANGRAAQLEFSGGSTLFSYSLERALWRDQHRLLSATLRLDDKSAENYLQASRLAVQSPHYQSLEAGLNGLWLGSVTWAGYLGYARGLGGWTANSGRAIKQPGAQTAAYGKWRASLSRSATYAWAELKWTLTSALQGQYSGQYMPQLEALSLAGGNHVRGFQSAGADSGKGVAWSNTLYLPFSFRPPLRLTPSLGLDAGWADGLGKQQGDRLLGAAMGLSLDHPSGNVTAHYQRSLYRRRAPTEPAYWRLALQLRF
jgi:hemolysin activation/secretion protein